MRRVFTALIALGLTLPAAALAQSYPSRVIKMIVPFSPGGHPDTMARLIGGQLNASVGTTIIDNRPGANGLLAARAAIAAEPDGHTLLYGSVTTLAILPAISRSADFDPMKVFVPVAPMSTSPFIMAVGPSVAARTVGEFIAYAKANPGKLNYASQGNGTTSHLTGAMFDAATGTKMNHVPYRGTAPAINDLLGGHVDLMFNELATSVELHKGGRAKLLAVTTEKRIDELPDVPTMQEAGVPNFISDTWNAISAPPKTPAAIVAKLNAAINQALQDPEVKAHYARMHLTAVGGTPANMAKIVKDDTERWGTVIKSANVTIE